MKTHRPIITYIGSTLDRGLCAQCKTYPAIRAWYGIPLCNHCYKQVANDISQKGK